MKLDDFKMKLLENGINLVLLWNSARVPDRAPDTFCYRVVVATHPAISNIIIVDGSVGGDPQTFDLFLHDATNEVSESIAAILGRPE